MTYDADICGLMIRLSYRGVVPYTKAGNALMRQRAVAMKSGAVISVSGRITHPAGWSPDRTDRP